MPQFISNITWIPLHYKRGHKMRFLQLILKYYAGNNVLSLIWPIL